jgi:DNA-binding XRE family transcriptional regulator
MGDLLPMTRGRRDLAPVSEPAPRSQPEPEPLWREALGRQLRAERSVRGERIADVARKAGVSPQYLSEVERGRKDPSSEILSALAGAMDLSVRELTRRAGVHLRAGSGQVLMSVAA